MRNLYVVASFIIALFMMFARPAAADEILTYQVNARLTQYTPGQYNIAGQIIYDLTTNQVEFNTEVDLLTPSGNIPGRVEEWYLCCGSQGASVFFFGTTAVGTIPGLPPIDGFSFETAFPINTGWNGDLYANGIQSGEYSYANGTVSPPGYGAQLTLASVTGVPEPSSALLLVSGLALLLFRLKLKRHRFV